MSDSSIALKPVIDEPSKPMPSSSAPSISLGRDREALQMPLDVREPEQDELDALVLDPLEHVLARAAGSLVALSTVSTFVLLRIDPRNAKSPGRNCPRPRRLKRTVAV